LSRAKGGWRRIFMSGVDPEERTRGTTGRKKTRERGRGEDRGKKSTRQVVDTGRTELRSKVF